MLICCAEELRATACVVVDALVVRGFSVSLCSGSNARKALRASLGSPRRGLRVLCVPRKLDRRMHRRLLEGLDGDLRRDLLVVPLITPRAVIDAIEARAGIRRSRPARRYTRTYLPYPTVAESGLPRRRWIGYGAVAVAATAAVAVVATGATDIAMQSMSSARASIAAFDAPRAEPAPEPPSALLDASVYSAVATIPPVRDVELEPPLRPTTSRRAKRPRRPTVAAAAAVDAMVAEPEDEEEVIVILDDEAPEDVAPIERPTAVTIAAEAPPETVVAAPVDEAKPFVPPRTAPTRKAPLKPSSGLRPVDPFASMSLEQ